MIILWYLAFSELKFSLIPVPSAVTSVFSSMFSKIFSSLAFSTFSILPFSGQYRLDVLVPSLLAGTACALPLHYEYLGLLGVVKNAVG